MKTNRKTRVFVPVCEKEFDNLVDKIMKAYGFPSREHCVAVVANRIMHMPPDQDMTTLEYLGGCIRKNISYQLCERVGKNNAHRVQVEDLATELKTNPGNAQARDLLQKHASEGSPFAKEALKTLGIEEIEMPKTPEATQTEGSETL